MHIGQGHEHGGWYARGQGSNPIKLLVPTADGDTRALAWAATQVRIGPTGRQHSLACLGSPEGM